MEEPVRGTCRSYLPFLSPRFFHEHDSRNEFLERRGEGEGGSNQKVRRRENGTNDGFFFLVEIDF